MSLTGKSAAGAILLSAIFVMWGCKPSGETNSSTANSNANANASKTGTTSSSSAGKPDKDGVISSGTGVEKEKPSAGKANVQGKALYNGQPAVGVEAKLCETFNQYLGGCKGETFTAKTDSNGEYLIKDVPPRTYEGLIVKVFDTSYYVFATSGIVSSAKYKVEEGKTFFAPDTNLFKSDLKLQSPKAGAKIAGSGIEIKWDAYPDAAYYKFSVHADTASGATTEYDYINKRVDGLSYTLDKPLTPGAYTVTVTAYNGSDIKLSESADDIKFTVTGDAKK